MGVHLTERELVRRAPVALAELLDLPAGELKVLPPPTARVDFDLLVSGAGKKFALEVTVPATAGQVASHAERVVEATRKLPHRAVPVVVVPYMTEAARRACAAAGASWFDLSGNAHIVAAGLRVIVGGLPDRFRTPGRPASIFAPKSARVVRLLLEHPERVFTQREIARAAGMSEGFVSRIVARLEADKYVVRAGVDGEGDGRGSGFGFGSASGAGDGDGSGGSHRGKAPIRVRDASLLLDAWHDEYRFDKHILIAGHVAARSGDALAHLVSDVLVAAKVNHAATGLAAAWFLTHFAAFRIATFFVEAEPSSEVMKTLGFRADARGANLWFVVPNDAGVFLGADDRDEVRCVHPVQAYLDLKGHPERAPEAAEHLRAELPNWKRDV